MCLLANWTALMAASLPREFLAPAPVLDTTCRTLRPANTFFARAGMVSFADPRGSSTFCKKEIHKGHVRPVLATCLVPRIASDKDITTFKIAN